jgi:thiosulfate/3-mercaptopyruvate sulfurtransferase
VPQPLLPLLVEPAELEPKLGVPGLLLVDLNRAEIYAQAHLPAAVRVEYADINAANPPAMGLLPDAARLSQVMSAIGLTPETHVVAYDAEGNSRAARFLWTLEVIGHKHYSLLNGGLVAWQQEGHRVTTEPATPKPSRYTVALHDTAMADKQWILKHLEDPGVVLLDTRSSDEYEGAIVRAEVGGHIPGAVNYDYANAIDATNKLRLKPVEEIRQTLRSKGVMPEKEVVVYCQTHHRSAHTWFVLKLLGFGRVRGYAGSWSEWGNSPDVPVEQD